MGPASPFAWSAEALATVGGYTPKTLLGWSLRETGGANPVTIELRDGAAGGQVLAEIVIAAGAATQPGDIAPIASANGIFMHVAAGTGTPAGAIFIR